MKEFKTEKKSEINQAHTKVKSSSEKRAEYDFPKDYLDFPKDYLNGGFQSPERFASLVGKLSHPANATPMAHFLTHLQMTYGNRSVQRLLQSSAGVNKPWDRRQPEAAIPPEVMEPVIPAEREEATLPLERLMPAVEEEGMVAREEEAAEEAARGAGAGTTVIRGSRELWYFNGETPANYTVSERLSTNRSGGMFNWSASPQLTLSSPTDATPTVTTAAASAARNDAWIRIRHSDTSGNPSAASYRLTILSPASLTHLRDVDTADAVWGYDCEIHYSIMNQFGIVLPSNVPINEQWTGGIVADFPFMDWRRGAEGAATVNPTDWLDHIQGELAGHFPPPVGPGNLLAGIPVYHWPGDWRVGSLTIGNGSRVISVTWQKNMGYARHT